MEIKKVVTEEYIVEYKCDACKTGLHRIMRLNIMNILMIDCGVMSKRKCEKYINNYISILNRDRLISELGLTGWKRLLYKINHYI